MSYTNVALYDWMLDAREYVEASLGLQFVKISKLDIACDFNFNIQTHILKVYKNTDYSVLVCGEKMSDDEVKGVAVYAGDNPRLRLFAKPQLIMSNKEKTLTLKSYNKSKEIMQSSGKEYIADACGFKRIYRLEITCKSHKVLKPTIDKLGISEEDIWGRIIDKDFLFVMFENLLNRLIRFQRNRKSFSLFSLILKDLK